MFSKNTHRLHFIIFLNLPVSSAAQKSSPFYGCVIQLSVSCIGTSDHRAAAGFWYSQTCQSSWTCVHTAALLCPVALAQRVC